MSTTDTRAAFEALIANGPLSYLTAQRIENGEYISKRTRAAWTAYQAATEATKAEPTEFKGWYCAHCQRGVDTSEVTFHEQHTECGRVITDDRPPAAKATGTAGEIFGYGSSEKKNCLMSKAQYDNCAPKNRTAYDIPLYAHGLPSCAEAARQPAPVAEHGIRPDPDHVVALAIGGYLPEQQAEKVLRDAFPQTAPVVAVKTWQERIGENFLVSELTSARDAEISDLRAALNTAPSPVLAEQAGTLLIQRKKIQAMQAEIAQLRTALAATNRSQP